MPKKRTSKKSQRPVKSYVDSARELAQFVPSLRKYRNRKTLKPSEKSAITRKEKLLKGVTNLFPLTKKQSRKFKGKTFAPGIRAIRLRNVEPEDKVIIHNNGDITIKEGKNIWLYWPLDRETVRSRKGMKEAGTLAFEKKFPIEIAADLAKKAFDKLEVQGVSLWTNAGRSDETFRDLKAFLLWVTEKWQAGRYVRVSQYTGEITSSDPGVWVQGIAILLENAEFVKRRRALQKKTKKRQAKRKK